MNNFSFWAKILALKWTWEIFHQPCNNIQDCKLNLQVVSKLFGTYHFINPDGYQWVQNRGLP